jgi:hypothetical protein
MAPNAGGLPTGALAADIDATLVLSKLSKKSFVKLVLLVLVQDGHGCVLKVGN